jgi:purine-binding chemotaxis protein CheW
MSTSSSAPQQNPNSVLPPDATQRVCIFRAGQQLYCLPAASVEYVYPYCATTPVPHKAESIEGVVNLHGSVVPVVDMGIKCAHRPLERDPGHRLMLVNVDSRRVALHVETVVDVVDVDQRGWEEADTVLPGVKVLTGIVKYQDGLALLYDPARFFEAEFTEGTAP